jgi:hypothetical protein
MIVQASDNSTSNRYLMFRALSTGANTGLVVGAAATLFTNSVGTIAQSTVFKNAIAYANADYAMTGNGAVCATSNTAGTVSGVSRLDIGVRHDATAYMNGHIRRLTYYPTRLPNATLQALTTT